MPATGAAIPKDDVSWPSGPIEVRLGVIALFPRYEVLKSPFPEFAFRPGKHLAFAKQWFVEIPVCERLS
jgi:hypothetical protein